MIVYAVNGPFYPFNSFLSRLVHLFAQIREPSEQVLVTLLARSINLTKTTS